MKLPFLNRLILGLIILGAAGLVSFWFLVSRVYLDEAGIDLTNPPPVSASSRSTKVSHKIFVNADDKIFIDNKTLDVEELKNVMRSERLDGENQRVILRVHTDSRHSILIEIKDALDELNYDVLLELINTPKDVAK